MNVDYIIFNKFYKSRYNNYKFYPGVKYKLKKETRGYYYTITNVKLPKISEGKLYNVVRKNHFGG